MLIPEYYCLDIFICYSSFVSCMHACLSHFSCVWLFATLWAVAHQAPLSMGFSRQEYWSGLPCPPPGFLHNPGIKTTSLVSSIGRQILYHWATWEDTGKLILPPFYRTAAAAAKSLQSCLTLCDPMDWRPPVSSVHGILQAKILEWVAMTFSRESSQPSELKGYNNLQ